MGQCMQYGKIRSGVHGPNGKGCSSVMLTRPEHWRPRPSHNAKAEDKRWNNEFLF